jgi:hypothetical protein
MPPFEKHPGFINIRSVTQLISGLVFIGLGLYILVSTFENNYVLVGPKKTIFRRNTLCLRFCETYTNLSQLENSKRISL